LQTTEDPVTRSSRRSLGLDIARVAAAVCIVALHVFDVGVAAGTADPLTVWIVAVGLRWAIPFFFVLAGFFHGSHPGASSVAWLDKRCGRLLRVFVAWTAVYFFFMPSTDTTLGMRMGRLFINGQTYYTLWFLGSLIACTTVAWVVLRYVNVRALLSLGAGCGILYVGAIALSPALGPFGEYVRSQAGFWWYSTPLYWLAFYAVGVWLGRTGASAPPARRTAFLGTLAVVVLASLRVAAVVCGTSVASPLVQSLDTLTFGILGVVAALGALNTLMRGSERRVPWLGALPLGIYLMHPLILVMALPRITPTFILAQGPLVLGIWNVVIASAVCTVATIVIERFGPLRQFL